MGAALPIARESASELTATFRNETPVVEILRDKSQRSKWFPGLAKRLSKDKSAAAVHHLTGERERTCYDWCAGAVDPPSRVVIKLLHTEVGWLVLEYLMRGCKQPWWLEVVEAREGMRASDAGRAKAREQLNLI